MQVLKDEIRNRIIEEAQNTFLEKGYADTTMRAIANQVGISVSNLYLYFGNKEILFYEVLRPIYEKLTRSFEQLMNHEDSKENLQDTICFIVNKITKSNTKAFILIFEKSKGTKYESFSQDFVEKLEKHILGQLSYDITNPKLITSIFAKCFVDGMITTLKAYSEQDHYDLLEEHLNIFITFYTQGIKQFLKE